MSDSMFYVGVGFILFVAATYFSSEWLLLASFVACGKAIHESMRP